MKLYTEVLRGQEPVLNASVKAEIENEDGDQWTVDLTDNGVGQYITLRRVHASLAQNTTTKCVLFVT